MPCPVVTVKSEHRSKHRARRAQNSTRLTASRLKAVDTNCLSRIIRSGRISAVLPCAAAINHPLIPTPTGITTTVASYALLLAHLLLLCVVMDSGRRQPSGRRSPRQRIHGEFAFRRGTGRTGHRRQPTARCCGRHSNNQEERRIPCWPSQNCLACWPAWRFPWASPFGSHGSADGPAGRVRDVPPRYTSKQNGVPPAESPSRTPLCLSMADESG